MFRHLLVCGLLCVLGHQASGTSYAADPEQHPNIHLLPLRCGLITERRFDDVIPEPNLYDYPWMTLIAYKSQKLGSVFFRCSGTIINSRYILTAANCINDDMVSVRVGEYNKCTDEDCFEGRCESHIQDIEVEEKIVHEGYEAIPLIKDNIALLRLKEPIDFSFKNVAPVCLPVKSSLRSVSLDDKTLIHAGWKMMQPDFCALTKNSLPIVPKDECLKQYKAKYHQTKVSENQICADERAEGACGVISGDPLMLEEPAGGGQIVQFGMSSHGPSKCGSDLPGVYTEVSKYVDWILDNLKE